MAGRQEQRFRWLADRVSGASDAPAHDDRVDAQASAALAGGAVIIECRNCLTLWVAKHVPVDECAIRT
jgi:hypothetical protein